MNHSRFITVAIRLVLIAGIVILWNTIAHAQNPPDLFQPAILHSLDGEKATFAIIASLPGPIPEPAGLFDIASEFRQVGQDLVELRSFQLFASLPGPYHGRLVK
jgi:hypothetical protein